MITGAHSLPQAEVMSLLSKRRFSFDTILRYLLSSEDVKRSFPKLTEDKAIFKKALIIGGGASVSRHRDAISILLEKNKDLVGKINIFPTSFGGYQSLSLVSMVGFSEYKSINGEMKRFIQDLRRTKMLSSYIEQYNIKDWYNLIP